MMLLWRLYRPFMRLAHYFNWHHTTVCYPDGDTMFWCQWCGMRDVMKRSGGFLVMKGVEPANDTSGW